MNFAQLLSALIFGFFGFAISMAIRERGATPWWQVWIIGFCLSLLLGAHTWITTGSPSCDEWEETGRGSICVAYADDGYKWSLNVANERAFDYVKWINLWATFGWAYAIYEEKKKGKS